MVFPDFQGPCNISPAALSFDRVYHKFYFMMHETSSTKNFQIEYKGSHYTCNLIENRGRITYQIIFKESHLYLTKAVKAGGILFWTSMPENPDLIHVVHDFGRQIDLYYK